MLYKAESKTEHVAVVGYYVKCRGHHYILPLTNENGYDERLEDWVEINVDTLSRKTGMNDEKGNSLWENDEAYVTRIGVYERGTIVYRDGAFWFQKNILDNELRPECPLLALHSLQANKYKIYKENA